MKDKFPSHLVDEKTGLVASFATLRERIAAHTLPALGIYGVQLAKIALTVPFLGLRTALLGIPLAIAAKEAAEWKIRADRARDYRAHFTRDRDEGIALYDFSKQRDRERFRKAHGDRHPGFIRDCFTLAALARMPQPPKVAVIEDWATRGQINRSLSAEWRHMTGSASSPEGRDAVILMGSGVPGTLSPAELRARAAAEIANLALKRDRETGKISARRFMGAAVSAAIVGAALFTGALPLATAAGICFTGIAGMTANAIHRRRQQALSDRGALLLTGSAADVMRGAVRLKKAANLDLETNFGPVLRFIGLTPPPDALRFRALDAFEKQHAAFCESRRNAFAGGLNDASTLSSVIPANDIVPRRKLGSAP